MSKICKIILCTMLLVPYLQIQAQRDFVLKDRYNGIEAEDGRKFVEFEVYDSIKSVDTYMSSIYTTLAEAYPDANIQLIGNRVIKMDATSLGISAFDDRRLKAYLDFSITIEARDYQEWFVNGETYRFEKPCVRILAPVVKKLTVYNPYSHSDVKVYRTSKDEIMDFLLENYYPYDNVAGAFFSEINMYVIHNIRAELNQNAYRSNGMTILAEKNIRRN